MRKDGDVSFAQVFQNGVGMCWKVEYRKRYFFYLDISKNHIRKCATYCSSNSKRGLLK